ncbi:hypothetical protein GGI35DRAFT_449894 [Trichoderma velutinum]
MRAISPSLAISAVALGQLQGACTSMYEHSVAAAGAVRRRSLFGVYCSLLRRSAAADEGSGWALTLLVAVRFGIATRQEGPTKHEDKCLKSNCLGKLRHQACSRPRMPSCCRASLAPCLTPSLPALTRKCFGICQLLRYYIHPITVHTVIFKL